MRDHRLAPQVDWLVRTDQGRLVSFRELTTLQKWIVEGRIGRDDEISRNGETWKRLGNIRELEPFFSVYEKARTFKELVESPNGAVPGLSASEILAPIHGGEEPDHLKDAPAPLVATIPDTTAPRIEALAPPPPGLHLHELASNGVLAEGREPGPVIPSPRDEIWRIVSEPPRPELELPPEPDEPSVAPAAFPATSLRASGSAYAGDLSFSALDAASVPDDPPKPQNLLGWLMLMGAVALSGVLIGILLERSDLRKPLQTLKTGVSDLLTNGQESRVQALLEAAQQATDLDTPEARERALGRLEQAQALRPDDGVITAGRAFVLARSAMALDRRAQRLDTEVRDLEERIEGWRASAQASERRGKRPAPAPQTADIEGLRAESSQLRTQAREMLAEVKRLVRLAQRRAPGQLEPERAFATYLLAEGSLDALEPQLARLQAAVRNAGHRDPHLMLLDAEARLSGLSAPGPAAVERATQRLRQALAERPTLNRARVLLAEVLLNAGDRDAAQRVLAPVLRSAPNHAEALELQARLAKTARVRPGEHSAHAQRAPEPAGIGFPETGPELTFERWLRLAQRRREAGQAQTALNAYRRAEELNARSPIPHAGKGWSLLDLRRPRLAVLAFRRALQLDASLAEAHLGLAEAHLRVGREREAVEAYRRYLDRAGPDAPDRPVAERKIAELEEKADANTATATGPSP